MPDVPFHATPLLQVGCAYIFLSMGGDRVSPVAAALLSTIEPALNPILVALVIGETVGPLSLLGAVLVMGARRTTTCTTRKRASRAPSVPAAFARELKRLDFCG